MALVTNSLQVVLVLTLSVSLFLKTSTLLSHLSALRWSILIIGLIISWGAVMDIRQALDAQKILKQRTALEGTIQNVENLNHVLRAQRHDFLNHLQTVYGLIEMEEYEEANHYIEKVYGNIQSVSQMLRTANPSVNALLQVKLAFMEANGIAVSLNIKSAWQDLPIPGWEMCRVLGNILDNAIDAVKTVPFPKISIAITEDLKSFSFSISNNGPAIPQELQEKIFLPNVTTKAEGQGMGLFISRSILQKWQGALVLSTSPGTTTFMGSVIRQGDSLPAT